MDIKDSISKKAMISTSDVLIKDLQKVLYDEINKPMDQLNEKVITSISNSILMIKGYRLSEEDVQSGKEKLLARMKQFFNSNEKEIIEGDRERVV